MHFFARTGLCFHVLYCEYKPNSLKTGESCMGMKLYLHALYIPPSIITDVGFNCEISLPEGKST